MPIRTDNTQRDPKRVKIISRNKFSIKHNKKNKNKEKLWFKKMRMVLMSFRT
jgi:hypothetical protein